MEALYWVLVFATLMTLVWLMDTGLGRFWAAVARRRSRSNPPTTHPRELADPLGEVDRLWAEEQRREREEHVRYTRESRIQDLLDHYDYTDFRRLVRRFKRGGIDLSAAHRADIRDRLATIREVEAMPENPSPKLRAMMAKASASLLPLPYHSLPSRRDDVWGDAVAEALALQTKSDVAGEHSHAPGSPLDAMFPNLPNDRYAFGIGTDTVPGWRVDGFASDLGGD